MCTDAVTYLQVMIQTGIGIYFSAEEATSYVVGPDAGRRTGGGPAHGRPGASGMPSLRPALGVPGFGPSRPVARRPRPGARGQVLEDEESLLQRLLDMDDREDVQYLCNRLVVRARAPRLDRSAGRQGCGGLRAPGWPAMRPWWRRGEGGAADCSRGGCF